MGTCVCWVDDMEVDMEIGNCVKCGAEAVEDYGFAHVIAYKGMAVDSGIVPPEKVEWLTITCWQCRYTWWVDCLDA